MKTVILCGGLGTRLAEETVVKPKPMVEIGGQPVLWHIMKLYAAHGFREFVLTLGYKGEVIKDYFIHYVHRASSLTVRMKTGAIEIRDAHQDDWIVHLLDTGAETQTGGRIRRAAKLIGRRPFLLTYGDGVGNVNLKAAVAFHRKQGALATVTAVRPPARFGSMVFRGDRITRFEEKPQTGEGWINGGFFALQPEAVDAIRGDDCIWERAPMEQLAAAGQLAAYRHEGFWQCMDTLRDVRLLNELWAAGRAPWTEAWK